MAALSVHSQPYPEASLCPAAPLPSQRLTRHALAILQLLTTEGDGVTAGDEGPQYDRKTQERKILSDQIMKLVLGILHLLNEGLETAAPFSEDDWLSVEKEQRQLYSDLITENDHTLGTLGSFTVKSEDVSAPEIEEAEEQEEEASEVTEMSEDPLAAPSGGLNRYADSHADLPKPELTETPSLASYQNPFLDSLKSGGLPMFPDAASYSDPVAGSYISHPALNPFPRSFPESSKDTCMTTAVVEAASMLGNGMADPYLGNSSDDFPVENMPIQIKREVPVNDHQLPVCVYDTAAADNINRWPSSQLSCRKSGQAPGTSSVSRSTDCNASGNPGSNVSENPGSNTNRNPGSSANRNPGSIANRNPGSNANRNPGSNTNKVPGSSMIRNPGSNTSRTSEQGAPKLSAVPNSFTNQTQRKRFQCEQCDKSFTYHAHLIMHRRVHTRERPYVCGCGKTFSQSSHLFRHQRSLRGNKASFRIKQESPPPCLQPPEGPRETDNNSGYVRPQPAQQMAPRRRREPAMISGMRRMPALSRNDFSHVPNPPHMTAGMSNATYRPRAHLPSAGEKHSERKRFACSQCHKSFNRRAHLIMHQRVHTRERPYVCHCGKAFTQSSNLFRHQRGHSGEKSHVCNVCGKAYIRRSSLVIHQRNHKEPLRKLGIPQNVAMFPGLSQPH